MVELHSWLTRQHPGLRTYVTLQQKTNELAHSDPDNRAMYRLRTDPARFEVEKAAVYRAVPVIVGMPAASVAD